MTSSSLARGRSLAAMLTAGVCSVLLALGVGLVATPASANTKEELLHRQQEYARQREQVVAALEGTNAALSSTYLALQDINARLPVAQAELDAANVTLATNQREAQAIADRLAVAEQQQATLSEQIADGQAEEARVRVAIGQLARTTYRDGADLSTLSVVLEATTPAEFADRYSAMDAARRTQTQALTELENTIAIRRNAQVRLDAVQERIAELKVEADRAVAAAEVARNAAAARKVEIERLQAEARSKAATLEQQRSQYQAQQAQIDADNRAVANQIAAIAAAEAAERERQRRAAAEAERQRRAAQEAARARQGGSGSSSGSSSNESSSPARGGLLVPPITGGLYVTSPYGYRVYPITGGWFMHNGVDLRSACGNRQVSAAAGTVVKIGHAGSNGTHGNQVIINHGVLGGRSTVTVYNHLSSFAVSLGQRVSQGQTIGYTGQTGNTTGCHVHFELWFDGSTVDPMNYL